jgi:hypothetical protein
MHLVNIAHTQQAHTSDIHRTVYTPCEHRTHTSGMHASCGNRAHTSGIHASCEHRTHTTGTHIRHTPDRIHSLWTSYTHIRHACILWTSYTHQTCTGSYTLHDVIVNIAHTSDMHLVSIEHTSGMHAYCGHRTHIERGERAPGQGWRPYFMAQTNRRQLVPDFLTISILNISTKVLTTNPSWHIGHARSRIHDMMFLWTSYTQHAWTVPYTRHDVFCEHRTHIRHACILWTSYTHRACMHLVNIIHTSNMNGPVYTTWCFCEHRTHIRHAFIFAVANKKVALSPSDEMSMKNVDKDAVSTK